MEIIPNDDGTATVIFRWSTEHGECYDCGAPAAFFAPFRYGDPERRTDETKLCAVCAANAASEDEQIERIEWTDEEYKLLEQLTETERFRVLQIHASNNDDPSFDIWSAHAAMIAQDME